MKIYMIILVLCCILLVGCSSAHIIRTEPPGADIYVDEKHIGKSPASYSFSTSGFRYTYKVRAELLGFYPEEEVVKSHTDFWGGTTWPDVFIRLRKVEKDAEVKSKSDIEPKSDIKPFKSEPESSKEQLQGIDTEVAKSKLKNSFEKGFITIEQLTRANNELKSQNISKILKSFLDGKIDEKTFGELY